MQPTASFSDLCAHSFVWWLLTNALGAALIFVRFLLLAAGAAKDSISDLFGLTLISLIIPWFIVTYETLLWPVFALLPQGWALDADQHQERRGRMLLVILGPFALLVVAQIAWLDYELLVFTLCYLLAASGAATWMFRQWLWQR